MEKLKGIFLKAVIHFVERACISTVTFASRYENFIFVEDRQVRNMQWKCRTVKIDSLRKQGMVRM